MRGSVSGSYIESLSPVKHMSHVDRPGIDPGFGPRPHDQIVWVGQGFAMLISNCEDGEGGGGCGGARARAHRIDCKPFTGDESLTAAGTSLSAGPSRDGSGLLSCILGT